MFASGLVARARGFEPSHALIALGLLGLCARLVVVHKTLGSNDMVAWHGFAEQIQRIGLGRQYDTNPLFNHPPLMGLFAGKLFALATWSGVRFEVLFKVPLVLADALSAWLVFRSWRKRSRLQAGAAFALFCWNPVSLLVTGYHGNTDSLCAALSLLAAMLMDAEFALLAGLALGASINVKLIPVLLIPALLSCAKSPRQALRFLVGLSFGALPYAPLVLTHWQGFRSHVLGWRSFPGEWGITGLLGEIGQNRHFAALAGAVNRFWIERGAAIVLGFSVILAVINRLGRSRFSAREMVALSYVGFVVLAPGWGIQYSVYPVPALFAANVGRAAAYGSVAGLYVIVVYVSLWTGTLPYYSDFYSGQPLGGKLVGYLAWLVGIRTLFDLFRKRREPPSLAPSSS
jgi:hypothetical protein